MCVGDGEAGLQTYWTGRLTAEQTTCLRKRLATRRQGLPGDKTMPPCYIIDPLWPHTPVPWRVATSASLPPHSTSETDLLGEDSVNLREWGRKGDSGL